MNRAKLILTSLGLLFTQLASAQTLAKDSSFYNIFGTLPVELSIIFILLLLFLGVVIVLLTGVLIDLGRYSRKEMKAKGEALPFLVSLFGLFDGDFEEALSGDNEDVIIDDHDYDGIKEFDNDLPPWWIYGFYITIITAFIYMGHYHIFGTGKLQKAEYDAEIANAEILYADVDLVYEEALTDETLLAGAKQIFLENCATCHGDEAAGSRGEDFTAGPNLTDEYWLYGGNINDVYKTIKHGQGNGKMPEWKNKFNNQQIYEIASFIHSLKGTKVNNPKDPQGDKYEE